MTRPKCVEDLLSLSSYIYKIEEHNHNILKRNEMLAKEKKALEDENDRLFRVICDEGQKWADHHTDPAKKKYWNDFIRKLSE
jgi:predicted metal-dependent hydrolase